MVRKWRGDQEGFRHGGGEIELWTVPQGQKTQMTKGNRQYQKRLRTDPDLEYRQGKAKYPLPHPGFPYDSHSPPVGHIMAPTDGPIVKTFQMTYFPCHLTQNDPDPPPHYEDLFPPGYTPFPNPNTQLYPTFTTLPTPSICLDLPPYHSLFATTVPPDCCDPPNFPDFWSDPYSWDTDAGSDWDL